MTVSDLAKTQALLRALQARSEAPVPERPAAPKPEEKQQPPPPGAGDKGRLIDIRV